MHRARAYFHVGAAVVSLALTSAQPRTAHAYAVEGRPMPPEFKFASDSLFPVMHDPARAPWVLERLRPILAKFPNHAPFRQIEFWALANTGASVAKLAALTDSLAGGASMAGIETPGTVQQATHCLELAQVLFARRESLAVAESYVRRAIRRLEPTHPASLREACEDLLAQIARARDAASPDSLPFPPPRDLAGLHVSRRVPDTLDVRVHDTIGGKDWVSWGVQLIVALGAAFLGAWIGGGMTRKAAIEAIHTEWERERRHAQDRLRLRVESNLRRVKRLGDGYKDHASTTPFDVSVHEELEVAWNLYYRVADPIFTMGAGDLAERIDAFFVRCHTLAEKVKALESKRRELEVAKAADTRGAAPVGNEIARLSGERAELLTELANVGKEADNLIGDRAWVLLAS